MYEVTYRTTTRPTGLPAGAKVEQVSRLPLVVETNMSRKVSVRKQTMTPQIMLEVETLAPWGGDTILAALDSDQAREIAHALLEAAGDEVPDSGDPLVILDDDGDFWCRLADGTWRLTKRNSNLEEVNPDALSDGTDLSTVTDIYGPVTVVRRGGW